MRAKSRTNCCFAGSTRYSAGRSFSAENLTANAVALVDALQKAKPAAAKGTYMKTVAVSTTMGPSVRVDPGSALAAA